MLEQSDRLGGAIRTETDYTLPGFTHEVMSSWHPLFQGSAAYAELADDLHARGLEYVNTRAPHRDGIPGRLGDVPRRRRSRRTSPSSTGSRRATARRGSGSSRSSWPTPTSASASSAQSSGPARASGSDGGCSVGSGGGACSSSRATRSATCRDWTAATFRSEQAHGLLAPWVLHTGLGPDNAVSGFMTQVIACAVQLGGMPVPVGGGVTLVDALVGHRPRRRRRAAHEHSGAADHRLFGPRDGSRARQRRT